MMRRLFFAFGAVAMTVAAAVPTRADEPAEAPALVMQAPAEETGSAAEAKAPAAEPASDDAGSAQSAGAVASQAAPQDENAISDRGTEPDRSTSADKETAEPSQQENAANANTPDDSQAEPQSTMSAATAAPTLSEEEKPGESLSLAQRPAEEVASTGGPSAETVPAASPEQRPEEEAASTDAPNAETVPAASPAQRPVEEAASTGGPSAETVPEASPEQRPAEEVASTGGPSAETVPAEQPAEPAASPALSEDKAAAAPAKPIAQSAEVQALSRALSGLPAGTSDEERNENAALTAFYEARGFEPLWLASTGGFDARASAIAGEIARAKDFGLDPRDFPLPAGLSGGARPSSADDSAAAELKLSLAVLKYGRYARGGRIINPSEQLSSYLDRRPQLIKPLAILEAIAASDQPDATLREMNPKHPQFERLRQKYLELVARKKGQSAEAKRLLANMEEWRWMPENLGEIYIWNNIPDFIQRVVKDGAVVMKENIVVGQVHKETPIFSRPLRKITFKPTWIVPDSIKVREILPNLMSGGGSLLRQWDLELLKDGQPVNWRKVDWTTNDIRTYDVIQRYGSSSVMGKAKFSFPSQHTVFMHDAAEGERWMLTAPKRSYSHGCMRVQHPIALAELILKEDKGWDAAKVKETLDTGGNNNEIPIEHRIMVHMTYFTALVDDKGKLVTFPDVYGHEQRITLALEGKWNQIEKGRNHLAPVELNEANIQPRHHRYTDEAYTEAPRPRAAYSNPQRYAAPAPVYPAPAPSAYPTYRSSSLFDSLFGSSSQPPQYYQAVPGQRY